MALFFTIGREEIKNCYAKIDIILGIALFYIGTENFFSFYAFYSLIKTKQISLRLSLIRLIFLTLYVSFIINLFVTIYDKYEQCKIISPDLVFNQMFVIGFGLLYGLKWIFYMILFFLIYPILYFKNKAKNRGHPRYKSYFCYLH